ncbi:MAG: hypothetical protein RI894_1224 [Bacteroidota bacterium]|jgi:Zn-dependent protease
MNQKLRIAVVSGIPIYIHWSFLLILCYTAYRSVEEGSNWQGVLVSIAFVLSIFTCVILHELGHAFAARHYGIGTRDIIMYPIGGVAQLNGIPQKPLHELVVAVAGPAVNLVIAAIIFVKMFFFNNLNVFINNTWQSDFTASLLVINVFLVAFNMIPAFPMDGGRVLRASIALITNRLRATFIAMWIGRIFAMIFVGIGLWSIWAEISNAVWQTEISIPTSPFLALIGIFIYIGAKHEYAMEQHTHGFAAQRVLDVMRVKFTFLLYNDPIQKAVDFLFKGTERDFLIGTPDGKICGILSQEALEEAYKSKLTNAEIRDFVLINFEPLTPIDSVETAYNRMKTGNFPMLPVVYENQLIGVVDFETVKLMARFRK